MCVVFFFFKKKKVQLVINLIPLRLRASPEAVMEMFSGPQQKRWNVCMVGCRPPPHVIRTKLNELLTKCVFIATAAPVCTRSFFNEKDPL